MAQRKTQQQLLDELVEDGSLNAENRDQILKAPKWIIESRELVMYLAALIITVGALRIVAFFVKDSSRIAIAALLYVVAVISGLASIKLKSDSIIKTRFSEVLELTAILAASIATGLVASDWGSDSQTNVMVISAVVVAWGVVRSVQTNFCGTFTMVAAIPVFVISSATRIDRDEELIIGIMLLIAGCLMIAQSLRRIGFPFLVRTAGSVYILTGALLLSSHFESAGRLIPIAVGALLFAFGAQRFAPEMLLAGAFCIIVGLVMAVSEWIPNGAIQGVVVIACGSAMLFITMRQMRKTSTSQLPDEPSA